MCGCNPSKNLYKPLQRPPMSGVLRYWPSNSPTNLHGTPARSAGTTVLTEFGENLLSQPTAREPSATAKCRSNGNWTENQSKTDHPTRHRAISGRIRN